MTTAIRVNGFLRAAAGTLVIAAAYSYFLIFAQFGFLHLIQQGGASILQVRVVMTFMGFGGIFASIAAARHCSLQNAQRMLQAGLIGCAAAAGLSLIMEGILAKCVVAAFIGASVGLLTVTLAASFPFLAGFRRFGLKAGVGTGLAYAFCNIPSVFAANPHRQTDVAIACCALGLLVLPAIAKREGEQDTQTDSGSKMLDSAFYALVAAFFALVCLDSGGFFILQNTPALNRFGWASSLLQWQNAAIHLLAAAAAGVWLDRRGLNWIPPIAFALLAAASMCLTSGQYAIATHWPYAAGVSLYSAALAFAPAARSGGDMRVAASRAGILFAVAGWFGSALGIAIAQNLHAIPVWLVVTAGILVGGGFCWSTMTGRAEGKDSQRELI